MLSRLPFPAPLRCLCLIVLSVLLASPVVAIKFNLEAEKYPTQRCIWNYANDHSLIIVTANIGSGSHQRVDIDIVDGSERGNVYLAKRNVKGETRLAITTHENADVGVCFKNYLDPNAPSHVVHFRTIELDVDIGADAVDYNAIANQESLSTLEVEMRKLEGIVKEVVDELGYLTRREARMRDTNESTNSRVQNFALITLVVLFSLGAWQILHLRSFFKKKYLID